MLSGKVKEFTVKPVTPLKVLLILLFNVLINPVKEVSQYMSNKEETGFVSATERIGAIQCRPNAGAPLANAVTCDPIETLD